MGGRRGHGRGRRPDGQAAAAHRPQPRHGGVAELRTISAASRPRPIGYVNRALPDAELDAYVDALATRISRFDKWAIGQTKRLVNTSLPPEVELGAGWDACIASLGRSAAQEGIEALTAQRLPGTPGDVEDRLGYYVGQIAR